MVPGVGDPRSPLCLLGEAPGAHEDLGGEPFIGRAGRLLDAELGRFGVDRSRLYVTNVVKCRPPGNRNPRRDEMAACRPMLEAEVGELDPVAILLLGRVPVLAVLGADMRMADAVGSAHTLPFAGRERRVVVGYHPAACLYNPNTLRAFRSALGSALVLAGLVTRGDALWTAGTETPQPPETKEDGGGRRPGMVPRRRLDANLFDFDG